MMFMKMLCKEEDVNADEDRKQADKLNKEFYVVDPITGLLDVRGEEESKEKTADEPAPDHPKKCSLVKEVITFLVDRTAYWFDYMADDMEIMVLKEIVRRMEYADPKTTVAMLQSMFLTNKMQAAAAALDILDLCNGYDADIDDVYESFRAELFDTEVFNQFLVANWFGEALGKMIDHACLS